MPRAVSCAHGSGNGHGTWRQLARLLLVGLSLIVSGAGPAWSAGETPVPLLSKGGAPVDWWFAFKFNSQNTFAGCGADTGKRACIFGGNVQAREKYGDPALSTCKSSSCGAPWGHSKGLLAWNDAAEGFVMQVSTPSWPGSGTSSIKRKAGKYARLHQQQQQSARQSAFFRA